MRRESLIIGAAVFMLSLTMNFITLAKEETNGYEPVASVEVNKTNESKETLIIDGFKIVDRVLIEYKGNKEEILEMPWHILEIGEGAFKGNNKLKKVIIPEGIEKIGDEAFGNCVNLKDVIIPETVTVFGWKAFLGCKNLEEINIPSKVKKLEAHLFEGCSKLKSVKLPKNLKEISWSVFYRCYALETIEIPNTVTIIGESAFKYCSSLKNIKLPEKLNALYKGAFAYCTSLKKMEIPEGINYLDREIFYNCTSLRSIIIPKSVVGYKGSYLFYNCNDLIIYGYSDTVIEALANKQKIPFVKLDNGKKINEENTFKVTFDGNKGTKIVGGTNKAVVYGKTYGKLPTVQRKGYRQTGWYTKKSGGIKVVNTSKVTTKKNHVLYAQWEKVKAPAKAVISGVNSPKKGQMKVAIKKLKKADGYEIFYSMNKNFKGSKKLTSSKLNITKSGLKSNTKFYVRVRGYQLDSANKKIYGKYSNIRTLKIK